MKSSTSKKALFIILGILVAAAIACGGNNKQQSQNPDGSPTATPSSKALFSNGKTAPTLRDSVRDLVIKVIIANREISDVKLQLHFVYLST